MTTIFAVHNSEGCVGRCDAKCHNATEPECDCVCGGAFHGAGRRSGGVEAIIRERYPEVHKLAEAFAKRYGLRLEAKPAQLSLFAEGSRET